MLRIRLNEASENLDLNKYIAPLLPYEGQEALSEQLQALEYFNDLYFEWRYDLWGSFQTYGLSLKKEIKAKLLWTNRSEGKRDLINDDSEKCLDRINAFLSALEEGFTHIDLEISRDTSWFIGLIQLLKKDVLIKESPHFFTLSELSSELKERFFRCQQKFFKVQWTWSYHGRYDKPSFQKIIDLWLIIEQQLPAIFKLSSLKICLLKKEDPLEDLVKAFNFLNDRVCPDFRKKIVLMHVDEQVKDLRVGLPGFSSTCYGCGLDGRKLAPGQLSLASFDLLTRPSMKAKGINKHYRFALLAANTQQSPSLLTHNLLNFFEASLDWHYYKIPMTKDSFPSPSSLAQLMSLFDGFSLSSPLKETVVKQMLNSAFMDVKMSDEVQLTQVANTLWSKTVGEKQRFFLDNSDLMALETALIELAISKKSRILLLGSGSCAQAFIQFLFQKGFKNLSLCARNIERVHQLIREYSPHLKKNNWKSGEIDLSRFDLVIQLTPIKGEDFPFPLSDIKNCKLLELSNTSTPLVTASSLLEAVMKLSPSKKERRFISAQRFFILQASYQIASFLGYSPLEYELCDQETKKELFTKKSREIYQQLKQILLSYPCEKYLK